MVPWDVGCVETAVGISGDVPIDNGHQTMGKYGEIMFNPYHLPSGYLTVCHGKSPFIMGKPSINGPSIPWLC